MLPDAKGRLKAGGGVAAESLEAHARRQRRKAEQQQQEARTSEHGSPTKSAGENLSQSARAMNNEESDAQPRQRTAAMQPQRRLGRRAQQVRRGSRTTTPSTSQDNRHHLAVFEGPVGHPAPSPVKAWTIIPLRPTRKPERENSSPR